MPELSQIIDNSTVNHGTVEAKVVVTRDKSPKVKYSRPPIEQITGDIIDYLRSKTIGGLPVEKLGFSCGKLIYGVRKDGGEIRVMALKARKKSLSVDNKSRAMYFFGIEDSNEIVRSMSGMPVDTSARGACSCQVKKPVFLVLDKVTFTENFNKDVGMVMMTLRRLIDEAISQKEASLSQVEESAD